MPDDPTVDDGRHNRFVTLDVAAEALGIKRRRAYQLAKTEHWRKATGTKPPQYLFADIVRTYHHRKETP